MTWTSNGLLLMIFLADGDVLDVSTTPGARPARRQTYRVEVMSLESDSGEREWVLAALQPDRRTFNPGPAKGLTLDEATKTREKLGRHGVGPPYYRVLHSWV